MSTRTIRVEFVGGYDRQSLADMIAILSTKSTSKQYDYISDNDSLKVGDFVLVQVDKGSNIYSGGNKPQYHLSVAYVREIIDGITNTAKERVIARVEADSLIAEERKKIELKALEGRLKQLDRDEELRARYERLKDKLSPDERERYEASLGLTTKH